MMHYLLVSDLISEEEFDNLLEKKAAEHAGILDEVTVAMMVVDDLGRAHIKIGEIPQAKTKIVSFYGKVLSIDGPREFQREGEEEPGAVANLVLGDPTGTTKMTMWDEKARAVLELKEGDVVEVIARPGRKEVGFVAMRESNVEIVETKKPPVSEVMTEPLVVRILAVFPIREIEKKDGSIAVVQSFLVGCGAHTARMTTWIPDSFSDISAGCSVSITGVVRNEDDGVVEYTVSDTAEISLTDPVAVDKIDAGEVTTGRMPVVCGVAVSVSPVKIFINRRGKESRVKNLRIRGTSGTLLSVALWNSAADTVVLEGDAVEVINADARPGRFTEFELSVGFDAALTVVSNPGEDIEMTGMIQYRSLGLTLETRDGVWILTGENLPEPGTAVTLSGTASAGRIAVFDWNPVEFDIAALKEQANS